MADAEAAAKIQVRVAGVRRRASRGRDALDDAGGRRRRVVLAGVRRLRRRRRASRDAAEATVRVERRGTYGISIFETVIALPFSSPVTLTACPAWVARSLLS